MRKLLVGLTVALGLALAQQAEVRVAVAANLRDAFTEIARVFEKEYPNFKVSAVFGASGNFTQQILQGAPFDLFLAADTSFPERVEKEGRAEPNTRKVYARGKLILFIPNRVGLEPKDLKIILDPKIRRLAIANPETAPYGRAAQQTLQALGIYEQVKSKLVFGQDIAQAAQLTLSAADAGFIPFSYTFSPDLRNQGKFLVVAQRLYTPLDQAYVMVKGRDRPEVRALYEFISSDKAKTILKSYGYETP
ncbi:MULTISPECIES: molybdate ABC transporter substrate-binding protein [unclassified Meiothermus]|uniref:molybdate ABC transporter substrate-binding protein n=1 Tax=unclassified Meiothermus TaxID=370471 RepID=UPI001314CF3D|nr:MULTISPECIES: molybdate ABC transporter substrate-binding protein [unclassified Meiothermus]